MSGGASGPAAHAATLLRFVELCEGAQPPGSALDKEAARAVLRELKAVGGDLQALRRALTGDERGPALWEVLVALGRDEVLARAAAALRS